MSTPATDRMPLVVHVGFAGSRFLFDATAHPEVDAAVFAEAVESYLTQTLRTLPQDLGLGDRYFFCGVSQLAVGADTLFTRACAKAGWLQRIFLPQPREDFLAARGKDGRRDFTDDEADQARRLFSSEHVIQERVVSDSSDRTTRFEDVNLELVRVSDLVICLVDTNAAGGRGGTVQVMEEARRAAKPLLEIRVSVDAGRPRFDVHHQNFLTFEAPSLPDELSALATTLTGKPSIADYCEQLKAFASHVAGSKQRWFKTSALVIIGAHVLATLCAVIAGKLHGESLLRLLLAMEVSLLLVGFCTHEYLHRSGAARRWAMARLVAEIARSVLAMAHVRGYLTYLATVPLPDSVGPLLRTLHVLHLRDTCTLGDDWAQRRERYVEARLASPARGQIHYYERQRTKAARWNSRARWAFLLGSGVAILATLGELGGTFAVGIASHESEELLSRWLNAFAIFLPVLAVAALSLAVAFDLEAREQIYEQMLAFLRRQQTHLQQVASDRAFGVLAMDTEARLLGETASWYWRHTVISVA